MYGTAFVDGVNIEADQPGSITSIQDTNKGAFAANVVGDLSSVGRNLLVFLHGFDNTFEDAFAQPNLTGLDGLSLFTSRISIYYSGADEVLNLSRAINSLQRLGQAIPTGKFMSSSTT
jgi:hypothetical protein